MFSNNMKSCLNESNIFGVVLLGDFVTIKRMPSLNVLGLSANSPPVVLGVKDCMSQFLLGEKIAKFVSECFSKYLEVLDPTRSKFDLLFFDGASNMQIGGQDIGDIYPRITCLCGIEHCITLFFSD